MRAREWFETAAAGFLEVVGGLDAARLDAPGLGEWDLRALLGHTCRAFLTLEAYVRPAAETADIVLHEPAEYFRAAAAGLGEPAQVAQRGREAGAALGDVPLEAAAALARRVLDLVARTPDDAVVAVPLGGMRLAAYLPTRAFELTVHGLDLARASGQPAPAALLAAVPGAVELALAVGSPEQRLQVLLAVTGREPLPPGFSVL